MAADPEELSETDDDYTRSAKAVPTGPYGALKEAVSVHPEAHAG